MKLGAHSDAHSSKALFIKFEPEIIKKNFLLYNQTFKMNLSFVCYQSITKTLLV